MAEMPSAGIGAERLAQVLRAPPIEAPTIGADQTPRTFRLGTVVAESADHKTVSVVFNNDPGGSTVAGIPVMRGWGGGGAADLVVVAVFDGGAMLLIGAVGSGIWVPYTPTWSGSNGALFGAWQRAGQGIRYRVRVGWGATTSHPAANQILSLPFAVNPIYSDYAPLGISTCLQVGNSAWFGTAFRTADSTHIYVNAGVNLTGVAAGVVTNAVPFTWNSGTFMYVEGEYEAA